MCAPENVTFAAPVQQEGADVQKAVLLSNVEAERQEDEHVQKAMRCSSAEPRSADGVVEHNAFSNQRF